MAHTQNYTTRLVLCVYLSLSLLHLLLDSPFFTLVSTAQLFSLLSNSTDFIISPSSPRRTGSGYMKNPNTHSITSSFSRTYITFPSRFFSTPDKMQNIFLSTHEPTRTNKCYFYSLLWVAVEVDRYVPREMEFHNYLSLPLLTSLTQKGKSRTIRKSFPEILLQQGGRWRREKECGRVSVSGIASRGC